MNIFFLDKNPEKAAQAHYDTHVVKMILETAQLLSTAHRVLDGIQTTKPTKAGHQRKTYVFLDERETQYYKATHMNHPCAVWVRESSENYLWTYKLFLELLKEYSFRFKKTHKTSSLKEALSKPPDNIKRGAFTMPPSAMEEEYKVDMNNSIDNYRNYYRTSKLRLKRYTNRREPDWL